MRRLLVLSLLLLLGTAIVAACGGDGGDAAPAEPVQAEPPAEPAPAQPPSPPSAPEPAAAETAPPDPTPASPEPAPDPSQTEPVSSPAEPVDLTVVFDGQSCETFLYTDALPLKSGPNSLVFENRSDGDAFLGLWPVAEGFTADEALAELGETGAGGIDAPLPEWVDAENEVTNLVVVGAPGSTAPSAGNFDGGEYVFQCASEINDGGESWTWFTGGSVLVESTGQELYFASDGESCTYDGPETIAAETYRAILDNRSDAGVVIVVGRLVDGLAAATVHAELPEFQEGSTATLEPDDRFDLTSESLFVFSQAGSAESISFPAFGPYPVAGFLVPGEYVYTCLVYHNTEISQETFEELTWTAVRGGALIVE